MVSLKESLKLILFYVFLVVIVMIVGYFLLPQRYAPLSFLPSHYQGNFLLWSFANFDGEHYLRISRDGYGEILGQSQYAFFPLFPLLISLLGSLTGGDIYLAANLIVLLSLLGFVYTGSLLSGIQKDGKYGLILKTLIFPGSIFLLSIYTEPLYLFLSTLVFVLSYRGKYTSASLIAALASATRINGVFLSIFLGIMMWQNKKKLINILGHILLSLVGFFSYLGYLYLTTGNPLAFFTAQSGWGKSTLTMPHDTVIRYFLALTRDFRFDLIHLVVVVEVVVTLYLLTLLYHVIKHKLLDLALIVYCILNLALPLATGSLGSISRFGLLVYPLFVATNLYRGPVRAILYMVSLILAGTGVILFTRGYWWA